MSDTSAALPPRASSRVLRSLRHNPSAIAGAAIILPIVILALLAPVLPIPSPDATSWTAIRKAPSALHWLGTDELGRDILSRMIWGARASLLAGVVSIAIALVTGVPLGILAGYFGGWVDMAISRVTEALLALPFLIMAIALAAFLGRR